MCSAINWIQSNIFILGIHYEVVHDIISYACKFVLSVLVIFIVFYSHRYSRYHDSGLAFHLNRLTRYHEPVLVWRSCFISLYFGSVGSQQIDINMHESFSYMFQN